MAKPGKKKKVLFVLEIVVLLLFIGGLYVYGQISSRLDKIQQPELKRETIPVNPEAPKMTGYKTYVLFGIDTRGEGSNLSAQNSDTMIIVSVNNDTGEVRMASIYRDTLLDVGDGTYTKANAAYAYGGPEQAIAMLNTNLDLDISDYATADFSALAEVVDDLGGLDIPLSYAEIVHMNNYCQETSKLTGRSYTPVEKPELEPEDLEAIVDTYHLNGVQVTSYCRIRYTASLDMGRTERQRKVLGMLFDKAKIAGLTSQLNELKSKDTKEANKLADKVRTELVELQEKGSKVVVYVDAEQTLDVEWAQLLGVNTDELILVRPQEQTAEQVLQIIIDLVATGDVGLCVVDSIPMLVSQNILNESLEKKSYGGISQALTTFCSKVTPHLVQNQCAL